MIHLILVFLILAFAILILHSIIKLFPLRLLLDANAAGVHLSLSQMFTMQLRKINPYDIIAPAIMLAKAGIKMDLSALEAHYLVGGNVGKVAAALIVAKKAGINLTFTTATSIDLAGRDICEAVSRCSRSKEIDTMLISAKTRDGVPIKAIAHIEVRPDINKLTADNDEETIINRVEEGIVAEIFSADSPERIIDNPVMLSKTLMNKRLGDNTAFKILSIRIEFLESETNI